MNTHSSTPAFFDETVELAHLESCGLHTNPFHFPKTTVIEKRTTETIFDTENLTFVEIQPDDAESCVISTCVESSPDSKLKYMPTSCNHPSFVCKTCLLHCLKHDPRFSNCPTCRNSNYCPRLTSKTITKVEGYETRPITESMINKYRKELLILERMKINGDYYRDNIHNKEFKDLTPYEQFYYNIHHTFVSDIDEDNYTELDGAYNFYIQGELDSYGVPTVDNVFNTPENTSDLMRYTQNIVIRNEGIRYYCIYNLNFMTRTEYAEDIAQYVENNPYSFSSSFVFEHLIQTDFKRALQNENNDLWEQIINHENDNEDFLRSMLKPTAELVECIEQYYIGSYWGDDIDEILGHKHSLDTVIKKVVGDRVIDQDVVLTVEESDFFY